MTDLYAPRRRSRRTLRAAAAAVLVAAAVCGGFLAGRSGAAAAGPVPAATGTPAPPWQAPSAPSAAPIDTTGAATLPTVVAAHRTAAGVPYGWPDTGDGAAGAAVTAVKAGLWFKYTLDDPWGRLGFLAATRQQTDNRRADVTAFLTVTAASTVGGQTLRAAGPCRCGAAVLAAQAPARQIATDEGFRTVDVTAAVLTGAPDGVRMSTVVIRVLLHWEGDWKLADVEANPLAVAGELPPDTPLPAPTWGA